MSIPDPIVLLDARARYVHPSIVCDRPSPKSVWMPQGVRGFAPANALPWDHDPLTGASRGLLIEASRTNIVTHSGDLTEWSESGPVAVSDSGIASTVRGKNWFRLESTDTGEATRELRSATFSVTEGEYYTYSIDAMPGEVTMVMLNLPGDFRTDLSVVGIRIVFNLQDGSVFLGFGGTFVIDARSTPLRNGAWRLEVDLQAQTTSTTPYFRALLKDQMSSDNSAQLNTGDGLYLCAPQVEPNQYSNAATSYIETAGSAAVRSRDLVHIPDILDQPWYVENEGTCVVEAVGFDTPVQGTNVYSPILSERSGDLRGFGISYRKSDGVISLLADGASNAQTMGTVPVGKRILVAYSYDLKEGVMRGSVNGGQIQSLDMSNFVRGSSPQFRVGAGRIGGSAVGDPNNFNGHISRVVYYPASLPNADLQSLSAIQE